LGAKRGRRLVAQHPLDQSGKLGVYKANALAVVGRGQNVTEGVEGGLESSYGTVALKVILSEGNHQLAHGTGGLKSLALDDYRLNYGHVARRTTQTNLRAELLGRFVVDEPLNEGGQLLLHEGAALRVEGGREDSANFLESLFEAGDSSVVLEITLSIGDHKLANAARSLERLSHEGSDDLGGAEVELLAHRLGIFLVGDPLNNL
jgi:hypothetical protein